jgi:hypothetical protein
LGCQSHTHGFLAEHGIRLYDSRLRVCIAQMPKHQPQKA